MSTPDKLISKLKGIVGEAHVIHDADKLKDYAFDGKVPKANVSPGTIDEASEIVAYANEYRLAIIPRGNGTKMGIGGIPKKADLVLSTGRLNRITDRDCENLTLSVESGIILSEVQRDLEKRGYFLPLDPPFTDKATLGGIVATNSSGPKRLLYGTARDAITGIKAVFPNGDIVVSGGKTVKNVSGYDMVKLLIGSCGTLGIICEITFNLLPLPEKKQTLLIPFPGLDEAYDFVREIINSPLLPASIDLLNATAADKMKHLMPSQKGHYLIAVGLEGVAETVERQVSEIGERGRKHGALDVVPLDAQQHDDFWKGIRDFAQGLAKDYPNLICLKSNVLIAKSGDLLVSYEKIARDLGLDCAFINRCGNGILYSHVLVGEDLDSRINSLVELIAQFTSEASQYEGNLGVESSPPPVKQRVDVWGKLRSDYRLVRSIKEQIDPAGILNPGRFIGGV
ncbi:MAG: FAD-binding oxidoreductase [Deltaproteobacteria bacterium]|nr:FAD-binding oxidoreductase [Deltaproteobacteria bacterium]